MSRWLCDSAITHTNVYHFKENSLDWNGLIEIFIVLFQKNQLNSRIFEIQKYREEKGVGMRHSRDSCVQILFLW